MELFSTNPARILNLERGTLSEGAAADVTLIDPDRTVTVDPARFASKSRNCPFKGFELKGAPWATVVSGRLVFKGE